MGGFSYALFSDEARDAVTTAATLARSEGAENVRVEHLRAAVGGAARVEAEVARAAFIPFAEDTAALLRRAHEAAEEAGERVELRHLQAAAS